jgi:hypothetical protein
VKAPPPRIAILAHRQDGFWGRPRLIHLLMSRWDEMGLTSAVVDALAPGIRDYLGE